jgi:hypothetical protein
MKFKKPPEDYSMLVLLEHQDLVIPTVGINYLRGGWYPNYYVNGVIPIDDRATPKELPARSITSDLLLP